MIEDETANREIEAAESAMDAVLDYLCQELGNDRAFNVVINWVAARRASDLETRGEL